MRKVEELVRTFNAPKEEIPVVNTPTPKKEYQSLKTDLASYFNSKVDFKRNNNGTGKIVIPFTSDEDLERIIAIFDKLNV